MIEYVDPTTGGPVFKTITFFVQMLRPGEKTLPLKQNASLLVRALRGHAATASSAASSLDWEPFDTFAGAGRRLVRARQRAPTRSPAILFVASDEPTLKALRALSEARPQSLRRGRSSRLILIASESDFPARMPNRNTKQLAHIDCPGGGQVWVDGTTLYIGHMRQPSGTTIVDVADPGAAHASSAASRCRPAGIRTRCASPTTS